MAFKRNAKKPRDWGADWSWSRLIEVLSTEDGEEVLRQVVRLLWRMQETAFRQLRTAIEDPEHPSSWQRPFLHIELPFPFAWETQVPLVEITSRRDRELRD